MEINLRTKPQIILSYEALFRQLKAKYRNNKILNQEYGQQLSGYLGERHVDYKLSISTLRNFHYYQGLRLKAVHYFQMDSVLLSGKFILILEVKNWKGELTYKPETNGITQLYQNIKKSYQNPILQVQSHELQLNAWLQQTVGIYGVPIETLVVISDPTTILTDSGEPYFFQKVIYADNLIPKIEELKKKHTKNILNKDMLNRIHSAFLTLNKPLKHNLIKKYNLQELHFISGIPCDKCGHYPMRRLYRNWECQKCDYRDPLAHVRKILDYFLLVKPTITNKECREILQLTSDKTAYTILNSMGLKQSGNNRSRKYHAPPLEEYPQQSIVPNNKINILGVVNQ